MISLDLFDYSTNDEIDLEVTKYVNNNLAIILRVLLDYLTDSDFGIDGFLPRDYLLRKPNECRNHFNELYEIIISPVRRDYINPKYEYLLYAILQWWEESNEESSELIPEPIPANLVDSIKSNPKYMPEDFYTYLLEELNNYNSYYYICFYDHDFLPSELSKMVIIYLRNQSVFSRIFPDIDLHDYIDLMPVDLREGFIDKMNLTNSNLETLKNIEYDIVVEIYNAIRRFQKRVVEFQKRSETEISNDICDAVAEPLKIKYNLHIAREYPMGRAYTTLGETDLYIYGNVRGHEYPDIDYAVIENKYIEKFADEFKQLLGYLNHLFQFGITISINKTQSLEKAIETIKKGLYKFNDSDFVLVAIEDTEIPYVIKSVHTIPEDRNKKMSVYHLILHLHDIERERIAKEARPKRK